MTKQWAKPTLLTLVLFSTLVLSGCKEEEPEPNPYQVQYEANVKLTPDRSSEVLEMIQESRGTMEMDANGNETGVILGSLSIGADREVEWSVLSKEGLTELDKINQIDIYLNGILRDEYTVPAHVLFGKEKVAEHKAAFKDALLTLEEDETKGRIVDSIVMDSTMRDPDVAHHFVDDVITHLNRVYVRPAIQEDFENRVVIRGDTFPLLLKNTLNSVEANALEFVSLKSTNRHNRSDDDAEKLNAHYRDSFVTALEKSALKNSASNETLGGFEQDSDGHWVPSDIHRLSKALLRLAYLK